MDSWPHSISYGPLTWTPEDLFGDSRGFGSYAGPSRLVKLPQATPDGGAISYSKEFQKSVVVGRESKLFGLIQSKQRIYCFFVTLTYTCSTTALRFVSVPDPTPATINGNNEKPLAPGIHSHANGKGGVTVKSGGVRADLSPNHWFLAGANRLKPTQQMTDVTWGPESYSNKILTSCSTGEVIMWDAARGGGLQFGMNFYIFL